MDEVSSVRVEQHTLTARDKTLLSANLYRPNEPNGCVVLLAPAMGFKQSFYRHYANYLAEQGFVVLTFDYRGIGASLNTELWGYEARLWQWGALDMQAALAWLVRHYPQEKLYVVGHSVGASIFGLAEHNSRVEGLMGIAASHLYWRNWPLANQPRLLLFWYVLLPLTTHAAGYFPASLFKLGEKLPKGIAFDWARSGRSPRSVMGLFADSEYNHYADFRGRVLYYSFADDTVAPRQTIDRVTSLYPNTRSTAREHISPAAIGVSKIGHHGFFRDTMRDSLWPRSIAWFLQPDGDSSQQSIQNVAVTDNQRQ